MASEANWVKLPMHLNATWGKQYGWSIYHSKFTRLKKIWRVYAKLKGLYLVSETGIGWDENKRCFLADDLQWNNLQMENQDYKNFRYCQCVGSKYAILSEILEGETASGSQAHSSAVPPSQIMRQHRVSSVRGMSISNHADETYVVEPDTNYYDSKFVGKRPATSQGGTSAMQGSRESKSSRSSDNNPFVECATSLTNYTSTKLEIKTRRESENEKYDVTMGAQVVESFQKVHPKRKVTALLKIQDNKWRKTFLWLKRELQEYWLNFLEIAPQN